VGAPVTWFDDQTPAAQAELLRYLDTRAGRRVARCAGPGAGTGFVAWLVVTDILATRDHGVTLLPRLADCWRRHYAAGLSPADALTTTPP
jgi:hypothetical protein